MELLDQRAEAGAGGGWVCVRPGKAGQGNKTLLVHSGPGNFYLIAAKRRHLDMPRELLSREISRFL